MKTGDTYSASTYLSDSNFFEIILDANRDVNFVVKPNSSSDFVSVDGTVRGLSGKKVTLWISTNGGYFEKDLNDGNALGSNAFSYSLKVPKFSGYSTIGIRPTMAKNFVGGTTAAAGTVSEWMPPRPQNVDIQGSNLTGTDFTVSIPNIDFTVSVKDTNGTAIPKAHVYAYSPSGDAM